MKRLSVVFVAVLGVAGVELFAASSTAEAECVNVVGSSASTPLTEGVLPVATLAGTASKSADAALAPLIVRLRVRGNLRKDRF